MMRKQVIMKLDSAEDARSLAQSKQISALACDFTVDDENREFDLCRCSSMSICCLACKREPITLNMFE